MENWQREVQVLAVGITAAVAVEFLSRAWSGEEHSPARKAGQLLLAGGMAAAYARLVPRSSWGLRSGAAFAQLPLVSTVHTRLSPAPPFPMTLWGALTGLALRAVRA
ncbi:MAG TPA: hypothetical protein VN515_08000 [Terriglobales bacterium]|nr:hypothetical protein [Terriglobales bacterium]